MRRYAGPVMTAVYTTHSNIARSCFDTFGIDENPKKVAIDDAIVSTSTSARQIKVQVHNFLCYVHAWTCRWCLYSRGYLRKYCQVTGVN